MEGVLFGYSICKDFSFIRAVSDHCTVLDFERASNAEPVYARALLVIMSVNYRRGKSSTQTLLALELSSPRFPEI